MTLYLHMPSRTCADSATAVVVTGWVTERAAR
jgi:hypothetical protein